METLEFKKDLFKRVIKPLFKKNGFLVSGTHWRKKEQGFSKVINFQLSQFNTSEGFAFYVNLGIFFPNSYRLGFTSPFFGDNIPEVPKNPSVHDCIFEERDGTIFKRIRNYSYSRDMDQSLFEKMVVEDIENDYLPFFDKLDSIQACNEFFTEFFGKPSYQYPIALGLASIGLHEEAKEVIGNLLSDQMPSKTFLKVLKEELEQVGNDFEIPEISDDQNQNVIIDLTGGSYP